MPHHLLHARAALGKEQVCTLLHGRVDEPGGSIGWSIGNNCFGHLIVMAEPADKVCNAGGGVWTGVSPQHLHRQAHAGRNPKTGDLVQIPTKQPLGL